LLLFGFLTLITLENSVAGASAKVDKQHYRQQNAQARYDMLPCADFKLLI
jgi:hypothetical protein